MPVWATLIALVDGDDPVVGLVAAPALQRRWWAAAGSGAYAGRSLSSARRLRVSQVADLGDQIKAAENEIAALYAEWDSLAEQL